MNAECTERILCGHDAPNFISHADVPKLNLAVPTTADEFPHPTTLHMDIDDPLLVRAISLFQCRCWSLTLIEDTDCTIAIASNEDIARNLVRGQGCDARSRPRWDFLNQISLEKSASLQSQGLTLVQISVAAFHILMTFTSPATSNFPRVCCQSKTMPTFLVLGTRSLSPRNAETNSIRSSES